MPSEHPQSDRLIVEIQAEFPAFRLIPKRESPFSRLLDRLLRLVTLGGMRDFTTRYHTVIGDTLFVPDCWERESDVERVIVLRHERVHLRQRRRLGTFVMAYLYLFPLFPIGLALGRAWLEWEGYRETLQATLELEGREAVLSPALRVHIVQRFTGPDYAWMWPFRSQVESWYDSALIDMGVLTPHGR